MPKRPLIGPPLGTNPVELGNSRGYPRAFPADLLREASRRLAGIEGAPWGEDQARQWWREARATL